MIQENWVELGVLILSVALTGYFLYLGMTLKQSKADAQEIATVAKWAVLAAEEFGRTGKLQTSQEKLTYAAAVFRKRIPVLRGVDDEEMMAAIHSFIPLANMVGVPIELIEDKLDGQEGYIDDNMVQNIGGV